MSLTTGDTTLAFLRDAPALRRRPARWCAQSLQLWLRLAELTGFFVVGIVAAFCLRFSFDGSWPVWAVVAAGAATIAAVGAGRAGGGRRAGPAGHALQVLAAGAAGAAVLALAGVKLRVAFGWGLAEAAGTGVLLGALHGLYASWFETLLAGGGLATHVALVGTGPTARRLRAQLEGEDALRVKLVGCYGLGEAADGSVRGSLRTLLSDCRLEFVDAIVLAPEERASLPGLRQSLGVCTQDIYLAPGCADDTEASAALGGTKLVLLSRRPITGGAAFAKRAFDVVGSLALIAFMAPLLGMLALAIAADTRGPILFRQLRVGYNNRLFYILKFRSMRHDATDRLAKEQTVRGDKRVTRVGRVIRQLSLDELPQLLNVLRGEMSLVGPRPHAPGTSVEGRRVHTVVDDYPRRHLVRPGITGLAQVRGLRGGLQDRRQLADRLAADLEYIARWSLWLDVRILLGTVLLEVRKRRGC